MLFESKSGLLLLSVFWWGRRLKQRAIERNSEVFVIVSEEISCIWIKIYILRTILQLKLEVVRDSVYIDWGQRIIYRSLASHVLAVTEAAELWVRGWSGANWAPSARGWQDTPPDPELEPESQTKCHRPVPVCSQFAQVPLRWWPVRII